MSNEGKFRLEGIYRQLFVYVGELPRTVFEVTARLTAAHNGVSLTVYPIQELRGKELVTKLLVEIPPGKPLSKRTSDALEEIVTNLSDGTRGHFKVYDPCNRELYSRNH